MERVTLALAGVSHRGNMPVLIPFALRPVPDDQYVAGQGCSAAFSHRFIVQVWNEAASLGARALRSVDIIVACVDTLHVRDEVQRFAWRHAIPLVDIGLSIHPRKDGSRLRIGGHVATAISGGPCLWCMGLLSEEKLAEEGGGRGAAYVTGGGNAQVISFNGVLASAAVNEVLDLLTGFRERGETPARLVFNGMSNTLEECIPRANPACPVCSEQLGRGVPAWVALPSPREMGTASSKPWNRVLAWLRSVPRYT
jgi:hypothetical protein